MYSRELLDTNLIISLDASFADNKEIRHSSYSYIVSLFGGLIAWKAGKQNIITTSTTKAEIKGVEIIALQRLFHKL
jgi:hypothetical protein